MMIKDRKLIEIKKPKNAEVFYRYQLNKIVNLVKNKYRELVKNEADINGATTTESRKKTLDELLTFVRHLDIDNHATKTAELFIKKVNIRNKFQFNRMVEKFKIEPKEILTEATSELLDKAIAENVSLIKSVHADLVNDISKIAKDSIFNENKTLSDIGADLKERLDISHNKAKMIAEDQSRKANSSLTEIRNKELGIDCYLWQTHKDGKVRSNHNKLHNKVCKYSDDTVYLDRRSNEWKNRAEIGAVELKPSVDYNCRCIAIPYIKGLN